MVLHSNQGSVYSSREFNSILSNNNIIRSISRTGTPTDNAAMESTNGWTKEEIFVDFKIIKTKNIPNLIDDYIDFFNEKRPSSSLNYKTPTGKTKWCISTINSILGNEKYCGDALLQKSYVEDFLTHRSKKNTGQLASIMIENHHESIINKETFLYVQSLISASKVKGNTHKLHYKPLAGTVLCGNCKRPMRKVTCHPGKKYRKNVLSCKKSSVNNENYHTCSLKPVDYDALLNIATNVILDNYKGNLYYKEIAKHHIIKTSNYIDEFYSNSISIREKIAKLEIQINEVIKKKISGTSNDGSLETKFNKLKKELAKNKKRLSLLNENEFRKNNDSNCLQEITKFIDDSSCISFTIIDKFIGKIIRKSDYTFRVILNSHQLDDVYVIDTYDSLLDLPVLYSKNICINEINYNYEVCKLGGYSHE